MSFRRVAVAFLAFLGAIFAALLLFILWLSQEENRDTS